jgi:hypothetical protein
LEEVLQRLQGRLVSVEEVFRHVSYGNLRVREQPKLLDHARKDHQSLEHEAGRDPRDGRGGCRDSYV